MNYYQIRDMDISNGEGTGMALFCSGCPLHCPNCFNQELWDFNSGKRWTPEIEKQFIELTNRPYINRVSFLGGEPLADQNIESVSSIISKLDKTKKIWIYTGYTWEELEAQNKLQYISAADVLVDGRYQDELKDFRLRFKGSSNQRIIDIKKSLTREEVVLYEQRN